MKNYNELIGVSEFDINGSLIIPGQKILSEEEEWWNSAYIFQEWDDKNAVNKPVITATTFGELKEQEDKMKREGIVIYKLFQIPPNASSNFMSFYKNLYRLAHYHFKDIFGFGDVSQGGDKFYNSRIILRRTHLDQIQKVIRDHSLMMYHDLIFFVIAELRQLKNSDVSKDRRLDKTYKYDVVNALHYFFIKIDAFPVKEGRASSNREFKCIVKILEFGLINLGDHVSDDDKVRRIANYPKRYKFKIKPVYLEAEPNLTLLKKYFDADFLNSVTITKHVQVLVVAKEICKHFGSMHLINEICHLITCIRRRMDLVGSQFTNAGESHPLLGNLVQLINSSHSNSFETNLTNTNDASQKLGGTNLNREELSLIKKSFLYYYNNEPEDLEVDKLTSKISIDDETKFANVEMLGTYQDADKRFLPIICTSLYKFFEKEVSSNKTAIAERAVEFIALVLQQGEVFNSEQNDETIMGRKVMNWLRAKE